MQRVFEGAIVRFVSAPAGEYRCDVEPAHRVHVHVGAPHRLWDWRDGRARDAPRRRGDVIVTAAGESRRIQWNGTSTVVSIELAPRFVRAVAEDLEVDLDRAPIVGAFSHRDPLLEHIAFTLLAEMRSGLPSEPLASESLATALAARLVRDHAARPSRQHARGGLAPHVLSRVVDLVRASFDAPITIADLARLANLSPYHFARQFRASTGVAPHAYIVRARVHEAACLILAGERPDEAAVRVGFAGRGHLTRHMRRWMGVLPGALARDARR